MVDYIAEFGRKNQKFLQLFRTGLERPVWVDSYTHPSQIVVGVDKEFAYRFVIVELEKNHPVISINPIRYTDARMFGVGYVPKFRDCDEPDNSPGDIKKPMGRGDQMVVGYYTKLFVIGLVIGAVGGMVKRWIGGTK